MLLAQSIFKKMKLLMSAKSEKDHTFFEHQQYLQNFSLLDISKSLTIFLNHCDSIIFNSIDSKLSDVT